MPRAKAPKPTTDALPASIGEALTADAALHGELITRQEQLLATVDARFGLDGPYERAMVIARARTSMLAAAEHLLVLGRACLLLKEHEPHGSFGAALEEIGIARRTAQLAMQAAVKFEGSDSKRLLASRLPAGKLLELVTVDDIELDMLAEGGTVAGLTLDEIDTMSTRELKAALRAERKEKEEELAARDEIIRRKDEKLHRLDLKARGLKRKPANERALELLTELDAAVTRMLEAGDEAKTTIESIAAVYTDADEVMDDAIEARLRHAAETASALVEGIEHLVNG